MNNAEFQLQGVGDPRLAVHATSALPAWLWSIDGTRILWANPVGARLFGSANSAELCKKTFGPADQHRRQVAQLAGRLSANGAMRLERLRGFGAALGMLVTCGCARFDFADGSHGILVAAAAPVGRPMPLVERLQRLVEGIETPIAAFARDGMFIGASDAARSLLGFRNLSEAGLDAARDDALKQGRAETPVGIGHMVLQRVGSGADVGLVALIAPGAVLAARVPHAAPPPEAAATETLPVETEAPHQPIAPEATGEAPAEFAPAEAFEQAPATEPAMEHVDIDAPLEPVAEAPAETASVDQESEPSAFIEAVAGEPASGPRRLPLRFMWRMDSEGRFSLGSDEFTRLMGASTAAGFGRLWSEIAERFGLDPDGLVEKAIATRNTWSGITLNWPVDDGSRLPVELSGLPVYDRARQFAGYRGFGVCRDIDGLTRLAALRRSEFFSDPPAAQPPSAADLSARSAADLPVADLPAEPDNACPLHLNRLHLNPLHLNPLHRLLSRLHNKPIWKSPWKRPRTSCRFARSTNRNRRS